MLQIISLKTVQSPDRELTSRKSVVIFIINNMVNLLDEKDYYNGAVNSYKEKPTDISKNLKVKYDSPTFDVYINEKQKIILITIRDRRAHV